MNMVASHQILIILMTNQFHAFNPGTLLFHSCKTFVQPTVASLDSPWRVHTAILCLYH